MSIQYIAYSGRLTKKTEHVDDSSSFRFFHISGVCSLYEFSLPHLSTNASKVGDLSMGREVRRTDVGTMNTFAELALFSSNKRPRSSTSQQDTVNKISTYFHCYPVREGVSKVEQPAVCPTVTNSIPRSISAKLQYSTIHIF
jgi:hypothetical protein